VLLDELSGLGLESGERCAGLLERAVCVFELIEREAVGQDIDELQMPLTVVLMKETHL
jgi:hypothetical protein